MFNFNYNNFNFTRQMRHRFFCLASLFISSKSQTRFFKALMMWSLESLSLYDDDICSSFSHLIRPKKNHHVFSFFVTSFANVHTNTLTGIYRNKISWSQNWMNENKTFQYLRNLLLTSCWPWYVVVRPIRILRNCHLRHPTVHLHQHLLRSNFI